jgi:putative peptidoglycan lipid II flippase
VSLFASGLEPEAFELAARLLRIMVWSAIPMLLTGIFRAFLQARNIFFAAVISDALINLLAVLSILAGKAAGNLALLGVGAIAGNAASMLMLVILCIKKGLQYRPNLDLRDEHITEMFKLMLPLALSSAVLEINQIMDKNLASALLSGTVSALNYSVKVNNVVTALIGSAVGVALFPKMSELAADGDIASLKKYVSRCITSLFPVIPPLTVGIVLMAKPAIHILLERGAFDPEDTARTAECLQMYALGLLAANMSPLVTRAFYSMKKSATPSVVSAVSVAVGIALNLALIGPMGHRGLALATSAANTLCFTMLLVALRKKAGTLGLRPHWIEFCKVSAAAALMGASVWFAMRQTPILDGSYAQCLLWMVLIAGGGSVLYAAALLVMRAEPLWGILRRVSGKKS